MKKLSTKPISSPGRTDKFPPPLMRFLRSNAGNKSRGRSRASPMFLRKKNTTAIETKEPSSPKVTCMGQVRVRRSSTTKKKHPTSSSFSSAADDGDRAAPAPTKCYCCCLWWVPHTLFCHRRKPGSCCKCEPVRSNWGCFGRKKRKALKKNESKREEKIELEENRVINNNNNNNNNKNSFVSNNNSLCSTSTTPPRNALLLTRCKSAPYRSSSLASRFWGSPLRNEETEQPKDTKLRFFKELEDSLRERKAEKEEKVNEMKKKEEEGEGDSAARPLVLTRCKSERPRTTAAAYGF